MTTIRLVDTDGTLYFPHGGLDAYSNDSKEIAQILIVRYEAGDCDSISWPLEKTMRRKLASALYDERECNQFFPSDAEIELPDGAPFDFDAILGGVKE